MKSLLKEADLLRVREAENEELACGERLHVRSRCRAEEFAESEEYIEGKGLAARS